MDTRGEQVKGHDLAIKSEIGSSRRARFVELNAQDVIKGGPNEYPFGAFVMGFDGQNKDVYQPLEPADPEGFNLSRYREKEVQSIVDFLQDNKVVALVGPSRSCKTEAVLNQYRIGEAEIFPPEKSVSGRLNTVYVGTSKWENLDSIKENQEAESASNIVILDEFVPDDDGGKLVKELVENGFKVVVCQGGRQSNQTKINNLDALGGKFSDFIDIPVVEISPKPLNEQQIAQIFDVEIESENKIRPQLNKELLTEEELSRISKARQLVINLAKKDVPLTFFSAVNVAKNLVRDSGEELRVPYSISVTLADDPERWKQVIEAFNQEMNNGHIVTKKLVEELEADKDF